MSGGLRRSKSEPVRGQDQIARTATLRNVESFCWRKFGVGRAKGGRRFAQTLTEAAVRTDIDRRGFELASFGETCGPVTVVGDSDRVWSENSTTPHGETTTWGGCTSSSGSRVVAPQACEQFSRGGVHDPRNGVNVRLRHRAATEAVRTLRTAMLG